MGGACCVAARDKDSVDSRRRGGGDILLYRNVRCSPTWSFRWENNARRVASEVADASVGRKGRLGPDRGVFSDGTSPLHESFGTPISLNSPDHDGIGSNHMTQPSELSIESGYPIEGKNLSECEIVDLSAPKLSYSPDSSFSTPVVDPLPICGHPLPPNSTPSRRARRSPGHRLLRQISDSRILGLKSPNNFSLSEGRSSFVLSTCSHDLAMGSHGGSSDGWSMRTFSELVASSQKGRWSFDSERFGSAYGKISGCSSRFSCSPSLDHQTCGACSKFLTEKSLCSSQRLISGNDLSVVAVLVCGHVYHAECLETMTLEVDKYDPSCPICMGGEKLVSKMSRKTLRPEAELKLKSHKISRNRVIDSYVDSDSDEFYPHKNVIQEEASKMEPSSSATSSSSKPFLRRHFSFGSKWSRSLSANDSARKQGFWARYRKD